MQKSGHTGEGQRPAEQRDQAKSLDGLGCWLMREMERDAACLGCGILCAEEKGCDCPQPTRIRRGGTEGRAHAAIGMRYPAGERFGALAGTSPGEQSTSHSGSRVRYLNPEPSSRQFWSMFRRDLMNHSAQHNKLALFIKHHTSESLPQIPRATMILSGTLHQSFGCKPCCMPRARAQHAPPARLTPNWTGRRDTTIPKIITRTGPCRLGSVGRERSERPLRWVSPKMRKRVQGRETRLVTRRALGWAGGRTVWQVPSNAPSPIYSSSFERRNIPRRPNVGASIDAGILRCRQGEKGVICPRHQRQEPLRDHGSLGGRAQVRYTVQRRTVRLYKDPCTVYFWVLGWSVPGTPGAVGLSHAPPLPAQNCGQKISPPAAFFVMRQEGGTPRPPHSISRP